VQTETAKLEHRLYGNGQPGDIQRINTRLDAQDTRVDNLEKVIERWAWKGLIAIIVIGVSTGGGTFTLKTVIETLKAFGG